MKVLIHLLLPIAVAAAGNVYAQGAASDAVRAALTGNTLSAFVPSGDPVDVYFAADGTVKVASRGSRPFSDSGVWTIQGNQYCTKYQRLRSGQESCFAVDLSAGDDITIVDAGGQKTQGKLRKGNVAGL